LRTPFVLLVLISLAITAARLAGELGEGPPWLFGRAAGGGGALVGIGWLMPVAGAWLGWRLARDGAPGPRAGALRRVLLAIAGVAVVFVVARLLLPVGFGTFLFAAAALPAFAVVAWRAWPELARPLLLFALAQRVPILVVTVLAVRGAWGTHYELLAPGSPPMSDAARTAVLCTAQLCLWLPLTLLLGGLAGLLAARGAARGVPRGGAAALRCPQ
jgi:hypothetical protein